MMPNFTESDVEEASIAWFEELGYQYRPGPELSPDGTHPERATYQEVLLPARLWDAILRLNPEIPLDALEETRRKVTIPQAPTLIQNNRAFHRMLVEGVPVEYRREDGSIAGDRVKLVDFDNPDQNDWLAVNQFTVVEGQINRRPDIVVFVNGLPLAVMELKNAADEQADIRTAFRQLQTYKRQIGSLMVYNAALVISDGLTARIGSLTANQEWFLPWRTIEGEDLAPESLPELETMIKGVFDKQRFLNLIRHFIVFEEDSGGALSKKIAGYHQFHAVNVAVEETLRAAQRQKDGWEVPEEPGVYFAGKQKDGQPGDRRIRVVWHTQGAGKSLTMAFYAGRVVLPVINAIIHRDYSSQGDIAIRIYGDRVIIANPGGLASGLSIDDLEKEIHPSIRRNPLLAQVFYYSSLMERWGTGTIRMIEACRSQKLPVPLFESEADRFSVTFRKTYYTREALHEMGLSERLIQAFEQVRHKGSITNKEYREMSRLSDEAVRRDLKLLVEKGILRAEGKGRASRYVPADRWQAAGSEVQSSWRTEG